MATKPKGEPVEEMVQISASELQALREQAAAPGSNANPEPAFEEGPHLKKADIRDAKRQQLLDAGFKASDEDLTDDMRSLLEGK